MGFMDTEIKQSSLYDRIKKLLISDVWSDCCFSVSGRDFKAHKLILGISSPVFEAMFYGPLSADNAVVITDIEPDIFQLILNYIYTDKVEISSIEEAFELLYASKKYILDQLSTMCINYIEANICADNVIEVLNYPEYLHDNRLKLFALDFFCKHAKYLLEENKYLITTSCMKAVLESDHINVSEVDLIKNVLEWTKYYCEENGISASLDNRRSILMKNGLFNLLRFGTLSVDEYAKIEKQVNDFFLTQDLENIKMAIQRKPMLKPRTSLELQWSLCNRNCLRSVGPIKIDSINSVIHTRVKANKSLFMLSLCIPTRVGPTQGFHNRTLTNYSEEISVSIFSESDNKTVKIMKFTNTSQNFDYFIDIELDEPCYIKENNWYKISFMWPQNMHQTYSYGIQLRDDVIVHKRNRIKFEFDDVGIIGSFLEGFKYCI